MSQPLRDKHWKGPPKPINAWAALTRDGHIMAMSVRDRSEDVKLACGECVPIPVIVSFVEEHDSARSETAAEIAARRVRALTAPSPGQQLGKLGGAARAKALTAEQRKEIAQKAAAKRWSP